jgi:hypothetical protein
MTKPADFDNRITPDLAVLIAELKAQGRTSAQVAAELTLPLVYVNYVYMQLPITKDNFPRL